MCTTIYNMVFVVHAGIARILIGLTKSSGNEYSLPCIPFFGQHLNDWLLIHGFQ